MSQIVRFIVIDFQHDFAKKLKHEIFQRKQKIYKQIILKFYIYYYSVHTCILRVTSFGPSSRIWIINSYVKAISSEERHIRSVSSGSDGQGPVEETTYDMSPVSLRMTYDMSPAAAA